MKRTSGERHRRYCLANASTGTITRVRVVIYARVSTGDDPDALLNDLRRFAAARDWVPVRELVDRLPIDGHRQWSAAQSLVEAGRAAGIVTYRGIGHSPAAKGLLNEWLWGANAFLAEVPQHQEGSS